MAKPKGMPTDVYPRDNCIAPDIAFIVRFDRKITKQQMEMPLFCFVVDVATTNDAIFEVLRSVPPSNDWMTGAEP